MGDSISVFVGRGKLSADVDRRIWGMGGVDGGAVGNIIKGGTSLWDGEGIAGGSGGRRGF